MDGRKRMVEWREVEGRAKEQTNTDG